MFFRRKYRLRNDHDAELIQQLEILKKTWFNQKSLIERGLDPSEEAIITSKLAEVKYFYLFKEAKKRKIVIKR